MLQDAENLQSVVVEKSLDGNQFVTEKIIADGHFEGTKIFSTSVESGHKYRNVQFQ